MNCIELLQAILTAFVIFMLLAFATSYSLITLMKFTGANLDNTGLGILCLSAFISIFGCILGTIKLYSSPGMLRHTTKQKRKLND